MTDAKTYTWWNDDIKRNCLAFIGRLGILDPPWMISIRRHDERRSYDQNARHWARMSWLETNVPHNGELRGREWWHAFLLVETGHIAGNGVLKVGEMLVEYPLPGSSRSMSKPQFSDLETKIDVLMAERGIVIPDQE